MIKFKSSILGDLSKILDLKHSLTEAVIERSSLLLSLFNHTCYPTWYPSFKEVLSTKCPNWPSWGFKKNKTYWTNQIHWGISGSKNQKNKFLLHFDSTVRVWVLRSVVKDIPWQQLFEGLTSSMIVMKSLFH